MENRSLVVLTTVGAALASTIWGAFAALAMYGAMNGVTISNTQLALSVVLVVLYALRAYKVYNGDLSAARRLVWLHAIGAIASIAVVAQLGGAFPILTALYAAKIVVHVFGGIPALLLSRRV